MKETIKRSLTGILCFLMLFISTIQTAFALPAPNEKQNNKPEYEVFYQSEAEDENGFTA